MRAVCSDGVAGPIFEPGAQMSLHETIITLSNVFADLVDTTTRCEEVRRHSRELASSWKSHLRFLSVRSDTLRRKLDALLP